MKQPIDPTGIARRKVERIGGRGGDELDAVVVEEPLEIRVDGETIGVTMRTPGDDARLALGFLYGEGILRALADVGSVSHCGKPGHAGYGNVIEVRSGPGVSLDADRILEGRRFLPTSSACGVCGRQSIDDLVARCGTLVGGATVGSGLVHRSVERMRQQQARFERTGGLHAAAAFDAAGELLCCYEDVGRHNAVDKVVGQLLHLERVGDDARHPAPALLVVSGRAGFEIVQKAAAARIAIVASVSAPTSLSIDLAARAGLTLVGFVRGDGLNVYTHPWRVRADDPRPWLRAIPGAQEDDEARTAQGGEGPTADDTFESRLRNSRVAEEIGRLAATLPTGEPAQADGAREPAPRAGASGDGAEEGRAPPGLPARRQHPALVFDVLPGQLGAKSAEGAIPLHGDPRRGADAVPPLAGPRIPGDASWEEQRFGAGETPGPAARREGRHTATVERLPVAGAKSESRSGAGGRQEAGTKREPVGVVPRGVAEAMHASASAAAQRQPPNAETTRDAALPRGARSAEATHGSASAAAQRQPPTAEATRDAALPRGARSPEAARTSASTAVPHHASTAETPRAPAAPPHQTTAAAQLAPGEPAPSPAAQRLAAAAEAARRRRAEAEARRQAALRERAAASEQEATPAPYAHLVPDATRGAIIVTAREQEQAEARRRSLAAELIERTDRMLQRKRAGLAGEAHDDPDPFDVLEESWREGLAGEAPPPAPQAAAAPESAAPPEPSWSTLHGREAEEEETRAILIDDRDPGNPAPVFWPKGSAGGGSR